MTRPQDSKEFKELQKQNAQLNEHNQQLQTQVQQLSERLKQLEESRNGNLEHNMSQSSVKSTSSNEEEIQKTSLKSTPPPIFVNHVRDFNLFKQHVVSVLKIKNITFKALSSGEVKLNTYNDDDFRAVTESIRKLNSETDSNNPMHGISYHTYQCKTDKPYRVVLRGLHHTTNVDEIKSELLNAGHIAVRVSNVAINKVVNKERNIKKMTYYPLFHVDLEPKSNNKNIFELTHLLHTKITVEPPRKNTEIPQCKRCQAWGHTKTYCFKQPKCVKCAESHETSKCHKPKSQKCKCVNCGQEHPANYKGCEAYKLKKELTQPNKTKAVDRIRGKNTEKNSAQSSSSYAETVRKNQKNDPPQPVAAKTQSGTLTLEDIWNLLQDMSKRIDKLESSNQPKHGK